MAAHLSNLPLIQQPRCVTGAEKVMYAFLVGALALLLSWLGQREPYSDLAICALITFVVFGVLFLINKFRGEQYVVPPLEKWGNVSFWCITEDVGIVPALPGMQPKKNLFSISSTQIFVLQSITKELSQSPVTWNHRVKVTVPLVGLNAVKRQELFEQVIDWFCRYSDARDNPRTDIFIHHLTGQSESTSRPFTVELLSSEPLNAP